MNGESFSHSSLPLDWLKISAFGARPTTDTVSRATEFVMFAWRGKVIVDTEFTAILPDPTSTLTRQIEVGLTAEIKSRYKIRVRGGHSNRPLPRLL